MFNGDEQIRFKSHQQPGEILDAIDERFARLGRVNFGKKGRFRIAKTKHDSSFLESSLEGELSEGKKENEWRLEVTYTVKPTVLCWVLTILLFPIGLIFMMFPYQANGEIGKAVRSALRKLEDELDDE